MYIVWFLWFRSSTYTELTNEEDILKFVARKLYIVAFDEKQNNTKNKTIKKKSEKAKSRDHVRKNILQKLSLDQPKNLALE